MAKITDRNGWLISKALDATTLTDWEQDFLDDMVKQHERHGEKLYLSDKQLEVLERIANKD